jgi:hypothetical protein
MRNLLLILGILVLLVSCNGNGPKPETTETADTLAVVPNKRNINAIGMTLSPEAQEFVKDWTQYVQFDTFITRYFAISNSEALNNAKDLSKMATEMKDSVHFEILQTESVAARFNILDNECKRLADMSNITAITPDEVSLQIKKILEAYSGVNAKLNSVLAVENLETELHLDPDFQAILTQTPKEDQKEPEPNPNQVQRNNSTPSQPNSELERKKVLMRKKIQADKRKDLKTQ